MNLNDILRYGHQTVVKTVDGLADDDWTRSGVCGVWSVKDIIAHLASFEHLLVDVMHTFIDDAPTPFLDAFGADFNDMQVAERRAMTAAEVMDEYVATHRETITLASRIPPERCRETGSLPWYGDEYSLDDFVVYACYGHKREHCAQIALFRKERERATG